MTLTDIVGVTFMLVGGGLLAYCGWFLLLLRQSRGWAETTGTILVSDFLRVPDSEGGWTYRAEVSYAFTVDGREYVGNHVRLADATGYQWSAPALRVQRKYRPGQNVRVIYDPLEPESAILERQVAGSLWLLVVFGVVFFACGFCVLGSAG